MKSCPVPVRSHRPFRVSAIWRSVCVILPAFAWLLYIGSARCIERPHIFSYLMAALSLWLFFRYREGGRDRRWLYGILPAHAVWANLHGGHVQGLAMVATFALGEALDYARARLLSRGGETAVPAGDVRLLAALLPGCLLASLLNPYGYRLLTFPFELTGMDLLMQQIYEWKPPYSSAYNRSTMFVLYMAYVGGLCTTFFVTQRDRRGPTWVAAGNALILSGLALTYALLGLLWFERLPVGWTPEVLRWLLYGILGLFCAFTVLNFRRVDFTHAGLFALLFLLSIQYNRAVTDAAMGMFVTLTASASHLIDGGAPAHSDRSSSLAVAFGSILLLGVVAHASIFTYYYDFHGRGRQKGLGVATTLPTCAVDFVEKHRMTGNAFVTYADAGMLLHRMYPSVKVGMDSRADVYGEALYREYQAAIDSSAGMFTYLVRHPVDFLLVAYDRMSPDIFSDLTASEAWIAVYYDDRRVILVRRKPETEALVTAEGFRVLRPHRLGARAVNPSNAAQLLAEAERVVRNCPQSVLGFHFKGQALRALNRSEEALAAGREVLARDPRNVSAYSGMAEAYAAIGQRDKAIEMLEAALRIEPGYFVAQENLSRLREPRPAPGSSR